MQTTDSYVDPTIYGGQPTSTTPVPVIDPKAVGGAANAQPYDAPAKVDQSAIGAGTSAVAEGNAAIQAANRPQATVGEASLAAVKTWTTTRFLESMSAPNFAKDPTFDPKALINHAPVMLNHEEQKWLAQSNSQDEFNYRLTQVQDQQKLYGQMGDHPFLSTALAMADPVYLAIDALSAGTAAGLTSTLGLSATAGRIAAGGLSVAGNLAVGQATQKVAPVSDTEILTNALINGAAAATFFHVGSGRFVKKDPTYPTDELSQAAARASEQGAAIEPRVVAEQADVAAQGKTMQAEPVVTPEPVAAEVPTHPIVGSETRGRLADRGVTNITQETDAYTALAKYENDPDFGAMIATLRSEQADALSSVKAVYSDVARPYYSLNAHTLHLNSAQDNAFTALHESIHGLTSQKLEYGLANPSSAHGRIVQELEQLRKDVKDYVMANHNKDAKTSNFNEYFLKNHHEFVAGLYSGNASDFTKLLSQIPVQGARNALSKMVDTVRKLLGIPPAQENALTKALGLSDELMNTKLKLVTQEATPRDILHAPSMTGTPTQVKQKLGAFWQKQQGATPAEKAGRTIEWSLSRSMKKGTEGDRVSRLLVDDPIDMTADSAASQKQAIRSDLSTKQYAYEDALKAELANRGYGVRERVFRSGEAAQAQRNLERQVYDELMRRDNAVRRGAPVQDPNVDPTITRIADLHDEATKAALTEMKSAGVRGADAVDQGAGYASRKWSIEGLERMEGELQAMGMTERQARAHVRNGIADAIQRAQPTIERDLAEDIAQAITIRTRNKGYFEDAVDLGRMGDDGAQGIRSLLQGSGISPDRMERIEQFLTGRKDDAGVVSSLKNRVDMDMQTRINMPDGSSRSLTDLVDTSLTRNLDSYLDDAAGQAALARKGLADSSSVTQLRSEYLHGIADEADRKVAAKLFDDTIKTLKGQPVGEEVSAGFRRLQAITQSVGLANSGLWQTMEYANVAAKYGLVRTARNLLAQLPIARQLVGEVENSAHEAGSLANVLARNSYQDMRIRPFLNKLEDNFEIPVSDKLTLALQQVKQLVPYVNAMRYIHHSQANLTANLITDTIRRATEGDAKAVAALERYGLEGQQLAAMRADIAQHGMAVDSWSDATWAAVRGPLNKMMDDAVLRNRTGEIPAFAQYSTLGKFIFTYRSFVLGAHNKVLAGTLGRHGFAGLGALMAYQFPLAMASSFAVSQMRGQPITDPNKLALTAIQQMSAMGMFSELWGIVSGEKQQFGAPGLMALDRLYKTTGAVAQGDVGKAAAGLASTIPLLAIMPGIKALSENIK